MSAALDSPGSPDFLAGGGEMGERTRALDWESTPVGPIDGWSSSLKAALSICLGSRRAMVVWNAARAEPAAGMAVSRRVLIVDDNEDAANSLAMLLCFRGHDVSAAYASQHHRDASGGHRRIRAGGRPPTGSRCRFRRSLVKPVDLDALERALAGTPAGP